MIAELIDYVQTQHPRVLLRDLADLGLTYYLIYRSALVLKGTRAMQAGLGLSLLLVLYVASKYLELTTVFAILGAVLPSALLIIVVVFQNDIRRGLTRIGSGAWVGSGRFQEARVIDEVIDAATELARHRIGALIAFEQDANLDEFVGSHKGVDIDAAVTSQLLVALFIPEGMNKLHDGSVIIRSFRIAKAGVFFPFTQGRIADESFGSRHRAALGITEETDAVLVVVSEERGSISFCFNGNIVSDLDGPRLRAALEGVFSPKGKGKNGKARLWSMVPESLRPQLEESKESASAPPPPTSVRLHATPPPGSTTLGGGATSPTKPLRKSVKKKRPAAPPTSSAPPNAEGSQ